MITCSRHCENVSPYSAKQQQWLRNCCTEKNREYRENGSKIAYFSHSARCAPQVCGPKMAQINFSFGKFSSLPIMTSGSRGNGAPDT